MIVLSGALVLVALVLLVFGALDRNLPYVYGSIGVSVLSLLLLLVGILQRRGELTGQEQDDAVTPVTDTSAERVPALVGAGAQEDAATQTAEPAVPPAAAVEERPASRRVVPEEAPAEQPADDHADDDLAEGDADDDVEGDEDEDEPEGSGVTVLVVSGRPRYHLEGCRVLRGKEPQPLDRDEARIHGFTPCGVCKPDADETPAPPDEQPADESQSFTEVIFGGPLFADAASAPRDRVETSELPDRPVQPVLAVVEPVADAPPADAEPVDAGPVDEPPADEVPADEAPVDDVSVDAVPVDETPGPAADASDLQGDDPADDPAVETDDEPASAPAPDVMANPDELPDVPPALDEPPVEGTPVSSTDVETGDDAERPAVLEPLPDEAAVPALPAEVAPAAPVRARKKAPAKRATKAVPPADETLAAPAKRTATKKTPAKQAPAKKAPAKRAPAAEVAPAPPAVKRPVVRAVRADALHLGAPSTGVRTTRVAARGAAAPVTAPPVVVVPDRDKFHRPECRFVRGVAGATTLTRASATRQDYVPCGVCKP